MVQYLTEEEQYKKYLNNDEISKIKDLDLRKIRYKYWKMRLDVFLDEHGISDFDLAKHVEKIDIEEEKELLEYRQMMSQKSK